ncbi:MAG: hypothetical protein HGA27_03960 [Peptococcaceae bacterium]|nr:hypothetical protein [Peptococcaceae bacterium]
MMHNFYGPGVQFAGRGDFWWLGLISMVIHLLFWIVMIYFAIKLIHKYFPGISVLKEDEDKAMSILRERYAKGEIDNEEFNQRKAELEVKNN